MNTVQGKSNKTGRLRMRVGCLLLAAVHISIVYVAPAGLARDRLKHGLGLCMPEKPDAVERNVQRLASIGLLPQALSAIETAVKKDRSNGQYLFLRAQLYETNERLEEAEADYRAAWKTGQLDDRELMHAAWEMNHFGGFKTCRDICDQLTRSKRPHFAGGGYFVRARLAGIDRDYPAAIRDYEQAIRVEPGHTQAYFELGRIYFNCGRYQEAVDRITSGLKQIAKTDQQTRSDALRWRGESYAKLGKNQEAIADLSQSIEISPLLGYLLVRRAEVYKKMGLHEKAEADLKKARQVDESIGI